MKYVACLTSSLYIHLTMMSIRASLKVILQLGTLEDIEILFEENYIKIYV
jgi:hypothetical protein